MPTAGSGTSPNCSLRLLLARGDVSAAWPRAPADSTCAGKPCDEVKMGCALGQPSINSTPHSCHALKFS